MDPQQTLLWNLWPDEAGAHQDAAVRPAESHRPGHRHHIRHRHR